MEYKNKSILPLMIFASLMFLAILFFIVWFFTRGKGFIITIEFYIITLGIFAILGLVVGIFIWLFKKQRSDMVYINKQRILEACRLSAPEYVQQIFLKGTHELESRFIGYVLGIARIKSEPIKELTIKGNPEPYYKAIQGTETNLTFLAFKRNKGILGWIEPAKLICLIDGDYTHLSGDTIFLNDMTFAPPLYDIFFLQRHYKDTSKIDEPISKSIYRYLLQENLKEIKNLADEWISISPAHQKALEKSRLGEIKRTVSSQDEGKPN